jgi:hypothetical protein
MFAHRRDLSLPADFDERKSAARWRHRGNAAQANGKSK